MALAERTWERVGERDRARLIESAVFTSKLNYTDTLYRYIANLF